jgi:hypothetical protein
MSTKIEDLPGPLPDDVQNDINELQGEMNNAIDEDPRLYERVEPNQSNIRLNVSKKQVHFANDDNTESGVLSNLKSEINEENSLLMIILIVATLPKIDRFVRQIPFVQSYITNDLMISFFKAALLVVAFIILKRYLLPKLKI